MGYSKSLQGIFENAGAGPKFLESKLPEAFYPGEIRLFPFVVAELPAWWFFCNGDQFAADSAVGMALLALPAGFRARWGIVESGGWVSLPNFFDASGNGYFPRMVDRVERQPGDVQGDAMRRIKGKMGMQMYTHYASAGASYYYPIEPPFEKLDTVRAGYTSSGSGAGFGDEIKAGFDSQLSLPDNTADEFRPVNIGFLPAIYLKAA